MLDNYFVIIKILKWAGATIVVAFVVLVAVRMFVLGEKEKTAVQVAKIHATKLTLDDVLGKNLPPDPGVEADRTVRGVDANNNGIRDDVELAVFKEYPNSAKTRAVLLQYALVLQMQMTLPIVNMETVTASVESGDRANHCIWSISSRSDIEKFVEETTSNENFVKKQQLNTEQRKSDQSNFYKYLGSYTSPRGNGCDLDLSDLPD